MFIKMVLLYRDSILDDNVFICFSIFSNVLSQFIWFAYLKFSLKYIPKIFVVCSYSFIVIFGVMFWIWSVWSILKGKTVIFYKFIVVHVALFRVSKNFSKFFTDSRFFKNKLESSAYCDISTWFFDLVCGFQ